MCAPGSPGRSDAPLIWVHVALAFGVVHHWSHGEAYRFTAEQSRRLTGVNAGAGIYLNYLFMLVWAGDCAFWWMAGCDAYRRRRRPIAFAVHGFLLFIAINATVVFAAGATRFVAATVCAALLLLLARRRQISDAGA